MDASPGDVDADDIGFIALNSDVATEPARRRGAVRAKSFLLSLGVHAAVLAGIVAVVPPVIRLRRGASAVESGSSMKPGRPQPLPVPDGRRPVIPLNTAANATRSTDVLSDLLPTEARDFAEIKPVSLPEFGGGSAARPARPANESPWPTPQFAPPQRSSQPARAIGGDRAAGVAGGVDSRGVAVPTYPPESLARREQGIVRIRVQVGTDGRPGRIDIEQDDGLYRLSAAAIEAVRHTRFDPATVGGVPVDSVVTIPFRFVIDDR